MFSLNMVDQLMFPLLLSTVHRSEQVAGIILRHFNSFSCKEAALEGQMLSVSVCPQI